MGKSTHDRYGAQVAEARQLDTLTGSLRPHEDYACPQQLSGTLGSLLHGFRGDGSLGTYDPHTAGHFAGNTVGHFAGSFTSAIGALSASLGGVFGAEAGTCP